MTDKQHSRPKWPHSEMTEAKFAALHDFGMVVSVNAKWKYTGADTVNEWLEVTNVHRKTSRLPDGWRHVVQFVGCASSPGLFRLTGLGEMMLATLTAQRAFDVQYANERAEYIRLKALFEGTE